MSWGPKGELVESTGHTVSFFFRPFPSFIFLVAPKISTLTKRHPISVNLNPASYVNIGEASGLSGIHPEHSQVSDLGAAPWLGQSCMQTQRDLNRRRITRIKASWYRHLHPTSLLRMRSHHVESCHHFSTIPAWI